MHNKLTKYCHQLVKLEITLINANRVMKVGIQISKLIIIKNSRRNWKKYVKILKVNQKLRKLAENWKLSES